MTQKKKEEKTEKCDASWREKRWERWQHFPYRHAHHESKSRFLWLRFIGFFLFISIPLLAVGGFIGSVYRMDGMMPVERYHSPSPFGFLFCTAPVIIIGLLAYFGTRAFRKMGTPLANVMTAADAVADGDLSVRVPERGPGEIRRLSESFNRMVDELARADQHRRNMTADVAHELRTPIHILRGNLEGILDGIYESTPEQIEMMLDETSLLTRLVDDLQTISLAEAGQLPLNLAPVNIVELLEDVKTSFSAQAEEAQISLTVDVDDADLTVDADAGRLDQVLSNLVANALRYARAETCLCLQAESSPKHVRLQIRDEGQGIPSEDLPFIFDRFYKSDKSRNREKGGSGLGLAIAKEIVQLHGGTIKVESELGKGTTFTIELPR